MHGNSEEKQMGNTEPRRTHPLLPTAVVPFLSTRNMAATIGFYSDILGFQLDRPEPESDPTLAFLSAGRVMLMFSSTFWKGAPSLTGQICIHLGAAGNGASRVMEIYERLSGKAQMLWGPEVYHYGRREFSCLDPNGYALVFSEETSDPVTCPGE